jgi:hypothetical protein
MRDLGAMNPVPYPTQAANSIAWIAYSYVIVPTNKSGSALLFWCNEIGFLMGIFFSLSLYGLARTKTRDRILAQMLFYALIIPLIGAVGLLSELSQNQLKLMWGFTANGILLLYYAAPLSTIVSVVKTKSAKSINLPLALCAVCEWVALARVRTRSIRSVYLDSKRGWGVHGGAFDFPALHLSIATARGRGAGGGMVATPATCWIEARSTM